VGDIVLEQSKVVAFFGKGFTKFFIPDSLILENGYINIIKKKWLGLKDNTESIKLEKVASIRLKNGLFWSDIIIETAGGASTDFKLTGVSKKKAKTGVREINDLI